MNIIQILARNPAARGAAVALIATAALLPAAHAQKFDAGGIARTELVRHDYDHQTEALQVLVDFAHGASFPRHSHPGVEIAYVVSGTLEYEMAGKTIRLTAGESLYIPAGAVHSARNVGAGQGAELATYLVEKNKPIVVIAK